MAKLEDLIKIEIVLPEGTQVASIGAEEVSFAKNDDLKEWGLTLRVLESVTFYNDANNTFNKLYAINQDESICVQVLMKVYSIDPAGVETLRQTYELPVRQGKWDALNCTVTMTPRLVHKYKPLWDIRNSKSNILELVSDKVEINFLDPDSEIQYRECTTTEFVETAYTVADMPIAACEPGMDEEGWVVVRNEITYAFWEPDSEPPNTMYTIRGPVNTRYARLFTDGADPGAPWFPVDGGFARPVVPIFLGTRTEFELIHPSSTRREDRIYTLTKRYEIVGQDSLEAEPDGTQPALDIDNGVRLQDVLKLYATLAGLTLVSDFFGVNPDNTAPKNEAYEFAADHLQNVLLFQASDIINASADTNAVLLNLSFNQVFKELYRFNVRLVDNADVPEGVMRLEHVSYISRVRHWNVLPLLSTSQTSLSFDHDTAETPRFERFKDKYTTNDNNFDEAFIEYDALCSDDSEQGDTTFTAPQAVTNIGYLFNNELLVEDLDKQKDTIVFVATTNNIVSVGTGYISGQPILNWPLAWSTLLHHLFLWDRPQSTGKINDTPVNFLSKIPTRKQESQAFELCHESFWDDFKEQELVRAQFGWSRVESYSYKLPDEVLEVGFKF